MLLKTENMICINADYVELEKVRGFIINFANSIGFDEITSTKIALAVDEVCTNLIKHSYHFDKKREICINVDVNDNNLIIEIFDEGDAFDPSGGDMLNMRDYFNNFKRGGLGLHIIKLIMDEIKYFPRTPNFPKNKLILIKYIK